MILPPINVLDWMSLNELAETLEEVEANRENRAVGLINEVVTSYAIVLAAFILLSFN